MPCRDTERRPQTSVIRVHSRPKKRLPQAEIAITAQQNEPILLPLSHRKPVVSAREDWCARILYETDATWAKGLT